MNDTYIDASGRMRPTMDRKLKLVDVATEDLDFALKHVRRFAVALQAGGACGLWPVALARRFARVHTFEPDATNFACLEHNTRAWANITAVRGALGRNAGRVALHLDDCEANNCGAYYVDGTGDIPQYTIDDLRLERLDLLCLDVEGRELDVLCGATQTLRAYRPVIMLECKDLPHMARWRVRADDAAAHLKALGWHLAEVVKRDRVFVHRDYAG
jgi:FkbM family methyltransferase